MHGARRRLRLLLILAPFAAAAPASAQADSAAPPSPQPAVPSVALKALVDLDYLSSASGGEDVGFLLRRVRLFTIGRLTEQLGFRVQLEPSVLAVSAAGAAPFRGVPLVEAYFDYQAAPWVVVRAGQQRLPFSQAAMTGQPSYPATEYPLGQRLLMQRVSAFRDIGVQAAGAAGALEYGVGVFNGAGINVPGDNNRTRDVMGRASYVLAPGWTVGASGWRGRTGTLYAPGGEPRRAFHDDAGFVRWGVDTRVARGRFGAWGEYLRDETAHNPAALHPTPDSARLTREGWHLMGTYRPVPRLELVARYDRWDPRVGRGGDEVTELTGGVQLYLAESAAPPHPRLGRALNAARRHSRVMLFVEHADPESGPASTAVRVRWELFY